MINRNRLPFAHYYRKLNWIYDPLCIGTTILEALRKVIGKETEIVFEPNPTLETFANQDFSFAIVAIGEAPYCETGGDDPELKIPFNGTEIATFVADRVPTVTILISGRPMVLEPSLLEKVDAFVAAWLPGTEGTGITDVLFGDYPFQGKLPVTWFKTVDQLPMHVRGNSDHLFPFGFGLTA